ncbi:Wadjet anti-phage system protein JetD domain-containing protein [Anatilimnocola floriformis]|uniref:Wadjet anti-phage system protein JetD domain-containing protein n=1 Tax=Anatilimnocola floriformis TaxID=2948575 RepID=UPI0020C317FD|nr:Wadjet anti-phage system protein JetD domain-containing protein [Anatilimnocola floriformis]
MTSEIEEFFLRVHQGLVRGDFQSRAPLKYRSLQLTGREKRLGELAQTTLFAKGRLDLEMLGCFSETPPLAYERISDVSSIIIFENADAFSLARTSLRSLASPPYGMVGFGGGNAISQSLPSLLMLSRPVQRIYYVGDLDAHGLRIASRASRAAVRVGLPQVEPAAELHQAMLESANRFGQPEGWKDKARQRPSEDKLRSLLAFLGPSVREIVDKILTAGQRVPEEVLGPQELQAAWS